MFSGQRGCDAMPAEALRCPQKRSAPAEALRGAGGPRALLRTRSLFRGSAESQGGFRGERGDSFVTIW